MKSSKVQCSNAIFLVYW